MKNRKFNLAILTMLVCLTGCVPQEQFVYIHVDNTTDAPYVVSVDGKQLATVQPGTVEKVKAITGERQITVASGGIMSFNAKKTLEPSDTFLEMRHYVLNPDPNTRYVSCDVHYDTNLGQFMSEVGHRIMKDDQEFLNREYAKLATDVKLAPADSWIAVPKSVIVLGPPPESISSDDYRGTTRTIMDRVDSRDYKWLKHAKSNKQPTKADMKELWGFMVEELIN